MQPLTNYEPPKAPLRVLHRDGALLVVDKPSGLLSVPGKDPAHQDCLLNRVQDEDASALLVHRLDMDTSGIMVFARSRDAQRHLGLQFERRHLQKSYEALVWGRVDDDAGVLDLPLRCDWPNRPIQMVCHEKGRPARTAWRVLSRELDRSRLRLEPETGRSHQLRVHMLALGHVILGDRFYAGGPALAAMPRLALHASGLTLRHPDNGDWLQLQSPVPF